MDLLSGKIRKHSDVIHSLAHSLEDEICEENMHESRESAHDIHSYVDRKEFILKIDNLDDVIIKPGHQARHGNTTGLDTTGPEYSNPDDTCGMRNVYSDTLGSSVETIPDIWTEYNERLIEQFECSSKSSDTSSACSGSDMMQSSTDDAENDVNDMPCNIVESLVDQAVSNAEEGFVESTKIDNLDDVIIKPGHQARHGNTTGLDTTGPEYSNPDDTCGMRNVYSDTLGSSVETIPDIWTEYNERLIEQFECSSKSSDTSSACSGSDMMQSSTDDAENDVNDMPCNIVESLVDQAVSNAEEGFVESTKSLPVHDDVHECLEKEPQDRTDDDIDILLDRRQHFRATPEQLMQQLLEDHSVVDLKYIEDFLLTYRTFLQTPILLANKLLQWFEDPALTTKVTSVVLLWVNNHFNDFELNTDMSEFLENFQALLEKKQMKDQLHNLIHACASKARPQTISLTRATRDELLYFQILGGIERGCGIFIMQVERGSKAYGAGLKRGDQILEVNGHSMSNISYSKAMEMLQKTTDLSITVKFNLLEFKDMLQHTEKNSTLKQQDFASLNFKQTSVPVLKSPLLSSTCETKNCKKNNKGFMTVASSKPKIRKTLNSNSSLNHSDENLLVLRSRKLYTSETGLSNHLSASNPNISTSQLGAEDKILEFQKHVVKVYRSDQSFKYLRIDKDATAKEVVMCGLQEFGVTDTNSNYSLCEVTIESESFIKQKCLPYSLKILPDGLSLSGRYYLKNNMSTESLVPDELMGDWIKEAQFSFIQLNTLEVTSQLTLEDFKVFKEIQNTEYIDEIFHLKSKFGCPNLKQFEELVNKEMFWVITEICSETNLVKRMKVIKHFIKIARHCQKCKNFNSMFAIVSGLNHSSVSRLHNTWERVPSKYKKMYEAMYALMDPSQNMSKYRNLLKTQLSQPPMLPIFPVIKKDLRFVHDGNASVVEGLVNFAKLRTFAEYIRKISKMCSPQYDVSTMYQGTSSMYNNFASFGTAMIKRTKARHTSTLPNLHKMFEEALMTRHIKCYLSKLPCIRDEEKLAELSNQLEPSESNSSTGSIKSNHSIPLAMYESDSSHSSVSTSDNQRINGEEEEQVSAV